MSEDNLDIPDTGAIFTFGKSRFADNSPSHFFVRKDPIVDLSCGDEHTVVVCKKGRVFSFGRNAFGELGLGTRTAVGRPNCVKTLKPSKIVHVASGRAHTLFLTDGGQIYSCGNNDEGQLGHGDNIDRDTPEIINLDQNVKQLSAGFKHSAALTGDGKVYVWGDNREGQLGIGEDVATINIPTLLKLESTVVQVSCGYYHTLLLSDEGKIFAFGEGENGKLGLGHNSNSVYPASIEMNMVASFVSAGGNHSCCLTRDGKLFLWGSNENGQIGLKDEPSINVPTLLQFDQTIIFVSLGDNHTAIIPESGELYTFGDNRHGKLAIEKTEEAILKTHEPTKVKKFQNFVVTKVSCGGCHTMVLALPKSPGSGTNGRSKNWEIYDVNSSTCSSKTALPPLTRLSHTGSLSPIFTPPSPSFANTIIPQNTKDSSSSTLSLDNMPHSNHFPDEFDEKEANEANGNYFQIKQGSPGISRSASNASLEKGVSRNLSPFHQSLSCSPKMFNVQNLDCSVVFEGRIQKHQKDMNYLAEQICSASRNLRQVMKNVETYFDSKDFVKKKLNSECHCYRSGELCSQCSWEELTSKSASTRHNNSENELRPSFFKSENSNFFSFQQSDKLFAIENAEVMNLVAENSHYFKIEAGDGPDINFFSSIQERETQNREMQDKDEERGAGEGKSYENHAGRKEIQKNKQNENKESSTISTSERKVSKLFTIIRKNPQQQKSFLVNDFTQKESNEGQNLQNKKSKMCVIL